MQEKKKSHPDFPPKPNFVSLHLPLPTTRALIGYPQQRLACILYGLHSDCEKKKSFLKQIRTFPLKTTCYASL